MINEFFSHLHKDYNPKTDNEHTHRTTLENFLREFCDSTNPDIAVRQEIKGENLKTPDFSFFNKENLSLIGLLENKKIGLSIDKLVSSPQIIEYRKRSENIIITNYHDWIRLKDGNITHHVKLLSQQELIAGKPPEQEKLTELKNLLTAFLSTKPQGIGSTKILAEQLALRCHDLREFLTIILKQQKSKKQDTPLVNLFEAFQNYVDSNLSQEDFSDAFAQTLAYSMLLAKLNNPNEIINIYTIQKYIPNNFELIQHLARFLTDLEDEAYARINHRIEEILGIINHLQLADIISELSGVKKLEIDANLDPNIARDPFIYFYEHFLQEYDPKKRKDRGVYYTPPSVVNFIIRGVNHILKTQLNISEGLADSHRVQMLDFATGTGTFLHETILQMFDDPAISDNKTMQEALVKDHILKNLYGFEYLMAPYAIAHLKLSQLLRDKGFDITNSNQGLKIYLTNTLDIPTAESKAKNFPFTQTLKKESQNAHEVKEKPIRVIVGNPPYAGASKNTGKIDDITKQAYAPAGEKKMNWDDYVKFIRFAHKKMEKTDKGIIAIITNNNFLNAITLREMRNSLMRDFNAIYILNLHGNSNIGEFAPDGKPDKNVFDIQVGVCITFLVKTTKPKPDPFYCDIYYAAIKSSKQKDKWKKISESDFGIFKKLEVNKFNRAFNATRWKNRFDENLSLFMPMEKNIGKLITQYGNFWGVTEIFENYGSGVKTERDPITIHHSQEDIENIIYDFLHYPENELHLKYQAPLNKTDSRDWSIKRAKADIEKHIGQDLYKEILYRPFDMRKTYYTQTSKGFIGTPGAKIMRHMLAGENYGLGFSRLVSSENEYTEFGIINNLTDIHYIGGQSYFSPLYNYDKDFDNCKQENLTSEFREFIDGLYGKSYTPEQILGYIYGVLHSPNFRKKYQELLKIDFPRIPFIDDNKQFEALAKLGWELIQAHLMKTNIKTNAQLQGTGNGTVEQTPLHIKDKNHLYINSSQYFDNVSKEIWELKIGGYQVLDKYLKERKKADRPLTLAELQHIPKIIAILKFTIKQMQEIDEIWQA